MQETCTEEHYAVSFVCSFSCGRQDPFSSLKLNSLVKTSPVPHKDVISESTTCHIYIKFKTVLLSLNSPLEQRTQAPARKS